MKGCILYAFNKKQIERKIFFSKIMSSSAKRMIEDENINLKHMKINPSSLDNVTYLIEYSFFEYLPTEIIVSIMKQIETLDNMLPLVEAYPEMKIFMIEAIRQAKNIKLSEDCLLDLNILCGVDVPEYYSDCSDDDDDKTNNYNKISDNEELDINPVSCTIFYKDWRKTRKVDKFLSHTRYLDILNRFSNLESVTLDGICVDVDTFSALKDIKKLTFSNVQLTAWGDFEDQEEFFQSICPLEVVEIIIDDPQYHNTTKFKCEELNLLQNRDEAIFFFILLHFEQLKHILISRFFCLLHFEVFFRNLKVIYQECVHSINLVYNDLPIRKFDTNLKCVFGEVELVWVHLDSFFKFFSDHEHTARKFSVEIQTETFQTHLERNANIRICSLIENFYIVFNSGEWSIIDIEWIFNIILHKSRESLTSVEIHTFFEGYCEQEIRAFLVGKVKKFPNLKSFKICLMKHKKEAAISIKNFL